MKKIVLSIFIFCVFALSLLACTSIGGKSTGERLARIMKSKQYNAESGAFQNVRNIPLSPDRSMLRITYEIFFTGEDKFPVVKLPEAPPPLSALDLKSKEIRFIWFGHSTILLEIDSKRILIDPIFSDHASPLPFAIKRFQPPVFNIEQLKDIDVVLISHDHYDHLDYETISSLKDRDIQYFVPLGVGAHLEYWGISSSDINELDWWEAADFEGIRFTCTPAQHFSGRGVSDKNKTLWASWAIQGREASIFFSGDSGYSEHYKEIGQRLGPFDLTFLENGAYNRDWKFVHQFPEQGVQAHIDLNGRVMVPVHWAMFDLALHSWYEPIQRVTKEARRKNINLVTPKLGQLVSIDEELRYDDWWSSVINAHN